MIELLAHYDRQSERKQPLLAHSEKTADLCGKACARVGLQCLGQLTGLVHDAGKATRAFQQYLLTGNGRERGSLNHSACGARLIADEYPIDTTVTGLTSQLIAAAVCGHHSGLPDCTGWDGEDLLSHRILPEKETFYEEAVKNFTEQCVSRQRICRLFEKAREEVLEQYQRMSDFCCMLPEESQNSQMQFFMGMMARFLESSLMDADRYDTFLFYAGQFPEPEKRMPELWSHLNQRMEERVRKFTADTPLNRDRNAISEACREFAEKGTGIYQLYVPTGGGKTLSALRFGLRHAALQKMERIFYVAPYKTILEQNAQEIRDVLNDDEIVLEHHSDVIPEQDCMEQGDADAAERYRLLSERWTAPVVLTTMVQFLQTLFSGCPSCIRRLHSLAHSVILLDEVQSIPVKFISMLNAALNYLAGVCGCTVILCTATQPALDRVPVPIRLSEPARMIPVSLSRFDGFRRTEIVDLSATRPMGADSLAEMLLSMCEQEGSVLAVLNTRAAARKTYEALRARKQRMPVYLLTTALCPANRIRILEDMRGRLDQEPLICISTQLIEAGVDISFGTGVRSLAGLDSIAQMAGRVNRHADEGCKPVFIIRSADENLDRLSHIRRGQLATQSVLEAFRRDSSMFDCDLLSEKAVQAYYKKLYQEHPEELDYPVEIRGVDTSLYSLLTVNEPARKAALERQEDMPAHLLHQAFATAGEAVQVIERQGRDVLVPYEEGTGLIASLEETSSYMECAGLLRKAQRYTVHLFDREWDELSAQGALHPLGNTGAVSLNGRFYDRVSGVTIHP